MELSTGERALKALRPVRVLHPVLLALCPLFGLYAQNLDTVQASAIIRPALLLMGVALALTIALTVVLRDRYKAGLVTSTILVFLVVVWGVLEDLISRVVSLFATAPPAVFYILYVLLASAAFGFAIYEYREDRKALRKQLIFLAAILGIGIIIATFLLSPIFGRRAAWLITAHLLITAYAVAVVVRYPDDFQVVTRSANWFSGILLGLYVVVIFYNWPQSFGAQSTLPELTMPQAGSDKKHEYPDIYFIALDGYGRADVLRSFYGYNSLPFEEALKAKGFTFCEEATSNYADASLALTSCLNLEYAHNLVPEDKRETSGAFELMDLYHGNRLFPFLQQRSYEITAFSPGIESMEPRKPVDQILRPPYGITEFEMVLLNRTAVVRFMEGVYHFRYGNPAAWGFSHLRKHVLFTLDQLRRLPEEASESPRFVYAYLPIPEPPYLLTRDGGIAQPFGPGSLGIDRYFRGIENEYRTAYLDQVSYLNKMLDTVTTAIVEKSKRPACIIIVSCRGAHVSFDASESLPKERFATLLAARFPEGQDAGLPKDLSPVNLFRATLNTLFGTDLPILPDQHLTPSQDKPFQQVPAPI